MLSLAVLSLASLAAAVPLKTVKDYARSLDDRAAVTEADIDNFAFYAEHSGAAYCNFDLSAGTAISCGGNCPTVEGNGVTIIGGFTGSETEFAGYVAVDPARQEIVFSGRGSSSLANWIANLQFDLVDTDIASGGQVHSGFNKAWGEVSSGVIGAVNQGLADNPGYRVVATGHSLGGAIATIAAAVLRNSGISVDLYTYGAPRVGNAALSDHITASSGAIYRVTHKDDPVPKLPPIEVGYAHVSPEYWLSGAESTGEDYPVDEVQVCEGSENLDCNGSTGGLNVAAHSQYFGPISDCTRAATGRLSDQEFAELEAKVDAWAEADRQYVNGQ